MNQARQGDIFVERISKLPLGLEKLPEGQEIILADSPATGHRHAIACDKAIGYRSNDGDVYFEVLEATEIYHASNPKDHYSIPIDTGLFRSSGQNIMTGGFVQRVLD